MFNDLQKRSLSIAPRLLVTTIRFGRIIDRLVHRTALENSCTKLAESLPSDLDIFGHDIAAVSNPLMLKGSDDRGANPHVRIEHGIAPIGERENKPFDQLYGKLARMNCLLDMIIFYVWKIQTSPGFLPNGLHESWPAFGPLKYFLPGYFDGTRIELRLKM